MGPMPVVALPRVVEAPGRVVERKDDHDHDREHQVGEREDSEQGDRVAADERPRVRERGSPGGVGACEHRRNAHPAASRPDDAGVDDDEEQDGGHEDHGERGGLAVVGYLEELRLDDVA